MRLRLPSQSAFKCALVHFSDKSYRLFPTRLLFLLSGCERTTRNVAAATKKGKNSKDSQRGLGEVRQVDRKRWKGGGTGQLVRQSEWETKTVGLEGCWVCNSRGSFLCAPRPPTATLVLPLNDLILWTLFQSLEYWQWWELITQEL